MCAPVESGPYQHLRRRGGVPAMQNPSYIRDHFAADG